MARKKITADLNGGDAVTEMTDLVYQAYDGADGTTILATYAELGSEATPGSDTGVDITVDELADSGNGEVVLDGVEVGSATLVQIRCKDENGNESILSPAHETNLALEILKTQTDQVDLSAVQYTDGVEFYVECKLKCTSYASGSLTLMGIKDTSYVGLGDWTTYFGFINSSGKISYNINGANNGNIAVGLNTWTTIKMIMKVGGTTEFYVDGVADGTGSFSVDTNYGFEFLLGKYEVDGVPDTQYQGNLEIDWIDINGVKWELNSITGSAIINSNNDTDAITTDRADVNDMLIPIS